MVLNAEIWKTAPNFSGSEPMRELVRKFELFHALGCDRDRFIHKLL